MDGGPVQLDAMLIAPLLAFLADTVAHHHNPVVTHTPDDGFGNAASRSDFGNAGFAGYGTDNVAAGADLQI